MLDAAGAVSECATSIEEALGFLTQSHFDVVVCALAMPGHAASKLSRELRERPPVKSAGVKRIAVCAQSPTECDDARLAGFDHVAVEPLTSQSLAAAVLAATGPARQEH
jgi:CheY-like chemotaxis protein